MLASSSGTHVVNRLVVGLRSPFVFGASLIAATAFLVSSKFSAAVLTVTLQASLQETAAENFEETRNAATVQNATKLLLKYIEVRCAGQVRQWMYM